MKPLTVIDMTVKRRTGDHLVTEDEFKGITPETAKEVLELKYITKPKIKLI